MLEDFGQAVEAFLVRQGLDELRVREHQAGLIKRAQEVFPFREIDGRFAPDGGVHHGQKRGWDLDEGHAPHEDGRQEPREVAHHPAPQGNERRLPVSLVSQELFSQPLGHWPGFGPFSRRNHQERRAVPVFF